MSDRRTFIRQVSAIGLASFIPSIVLPQQLSIKRLSRGINASKEKIWATFLHLTFNFASGIKKWGGIRTEFEPNETLWNDAIKRMAEQGLNMVVINLEDSILWDSHPEISLKNSWTPTRMREELAKIRKLGIEPIPMLNFSSTHDAWMGKYSRMLSTPKYYQLCKDLIAETIDIFDTPRFFHFGMDEESVYYQKNNFDLIYVRQKELWWGDLYFYIGEVMKKGVRPWVWADFVWNHPDEFYKMMPKSVLLSNWYYGMAFDEKDFVKGFGWTSVERVKKTVNAYTDLEAHGYDQIPTGSNDQNNAKCIGNTVDYCSKNISDEHLFGFLQALWVPTIEKYRDHIFEGIDLVGEARKRYEANIR